MRYVFSALLLSLISGSGYAATGCANTNPYLQYACQSLQQASTAAQQARDEAYQKRLDASEQALKEKIQQENQPPAPPPPKLPAWQEALKNPNVTAEQTENSVQQVAQAPASQKPNTVNTSSDEDNATENPPPPPAPTVSAQRAPVVLPGGVNLVPLKPKDKGTSGTIKYY